MGFQTTHMAFVRRKVRQAAESAAEGSQNVVNNQIHPEALRLPHHSSVVPSPAPKPKSNRPKLNYGRKSCCLEIVSAKGQTEKTVVFTKTLHRVTSSVEIFEGFFL